MLQFAELSEVFPKYGESNISRENITKINNYRKSLDIPGDIQESNSSLEEQSDTGLPMYELPSSILEEIEILGNLKKGERLRRIDGKIQKETRFTFLRRKKVDSREKASEDISRILRFSLDTEQRVKVQSGIEALNLTYKSDSWFKKEEIVIPMSQTLPVYNNGIKLYS